MKNYILTTVGHILCERNISFQEFPLSKPVHTVSDVALECKCNRDQIVKSLLFLGDLNPVLVVIPGDRKVATDRLSLMLNQHLTMATPRQVLEITSYTVGTVSPFLTKYTNNLILVASDLLLSVDDMYLGSGDPMILIKITSTEFRRVFNGQFVTDITN